MTPQRGIKVQSHPKNTSEEKTVESSQSSQATQAVFQNPNEVKDLRNTPKAVGIAFGCGIEFIDLSSGENVSVTNKAIRTLFQPQIKEILHTRLLEHVIKGEQQEADVILQERPGLIKELLTKKGRVTDYSGRVIEGTALQLALGAEDVRYLENEECMVEMLQRYLLTLEDGQAEIKKQYDAQFPAGFEKQEAERAVNDSLALQKVLNAILEAKPENDSYAACEQACEPALIAFRQYLENQAKTNIIKSGKHFNVKLLVNAFILYEEYYVQLGDNSKGPKNMLFWRKVVGFIQRYLPACYAQVFCRQGLLVYTRTDTQPPPLLRSLEFPTQFRNHLFFPLATGPSGLGFDCVDLFIMHEGSPHMRAFGHDARIFATGLGILSQSKTRRINQIAKLYTTPSQTSAPCCIQ